ncbi:MAG: putative transcriptional regulator [halophilic archaeon J07HB67]|jgi:Sugar-specific transcriptional regulator TrmB.|nr:MAG: putative transcriptional regulator [halophilic archaeon J07HB67]
MQTARANQTDDSTDDPTGVTPESVTVPESIASPRGKLVYLYLATHGSATETELCEGLEMKRITLYSVLGALRDDDIVSREGELYVAV